MVLNPTATVPYTHHPITRIDGDGTGADVLTPAGPTDRCPKCGEQKNPAVVKVEDVVTEYRYHCAVCNHGWTMVPNAPAPKPPSKGLTACIHNVILDAGGEIAVPLICERYKRMAFPMPHSAKSGPSADSP